MELLLGVRLNTTDKLSVIKLNDVDLKNNVAHLRTTVSEQINLPNDSFEFIYCGCLLENEALLESYGLKSGSMIHVLKKNEKNYPSVSMAASELDMNNLISVFKSFIVNPILEFVMQRIVKRQDLMDNIISSTPGLSEDAMAVAILHDPELLIHLTSAKAVRRAAEFHPALLEAAHHIATAVHEEAHKFSYLSSSGNHSSLSNSQNNSHNYSLDNLSEDDEMAGDSSQSSDSTQPSSSTTPSRTNSNLHAQLLARIARATGRSPANEANNSMDAASASAPPLQLQPNSNPGSVITFEMFSQAMQQAFASNSGVSNPAPAAAAAAAPSAPSAPSAPAPTAPLSVLENVSAASNLERQIGIMHEMGLQNDAVNIQALQITNGDVQAAIELVLSGFGDN